MTDMINDDFENLTVERSDCNVTLTYFPIEAIIYRYILCPLAVSGILFNIISIHIYGDKSFATTAFKYLRLLAIVDLVICTIVIPYCIAFYTPARDADDIFGRYVYLFYIYIPLSNIFSNLATLLTILVTIERLVSVRWPTHKTTLFSPFRFKLSCVIVVSYDLAINFVYFFFYKVAKCADPTYNEFAKHPLMKVFTLFREISLRFVPIVILIVSNGIIIHTVQQSRNRMKKRAPPKSAPSTATATTAVEETKNDSKNVATVENIQVELASNGKKDNKSAKKPKKSRKDNQLTHMAIFVAIVYIIGSIPMILVTPGIVYSVENTSTVTYKILAAIANVLELSQSCLRFFIYFCFTTQFRLLFFQFYLRKKPNNA